MLANIHAYTNKKAVRLMAQLTSHTYSMAAIFVQNFDAVPCMNAT